MIEMKKNTDQLRKEMKRNDKRLRKEMIKMKDDLSATLAILLKENSPGMALRV
jgi:vacuolar-type H+-ATPase subunit I/STV1